MPDDLADHVLGRVGHLVAVQEVGLPPADGPLGDVVRPDVGSHAGGGLAVAVGKERITLSWCRVSQQKIP